MQLQGSKEISYHKVIEMYKSYTMMQSINDSWSRPLERILCSVHEHDSDPPWLLFVIVTELLGLK